MSDRRVEISVGVFVLVGLVCLAYLTVKLGKMELMGDDNYRLTARFGSVAGLREGAVVDMAGVEIGQVDEIWLDTEDMLAVVTLRIHDGVPVSDDAIASVKTSGLIGDKYVQIEPGGSDILLEDGDAILETESAIDLEEVVGKYAFGDV